MKKAAKKKESKAAKANVKAKRVDGGAATDRRQATLPDLIMAQPEAGAASIETSNLEHVLLPFSPSELVLQSASPLPPAAAAVSEVETPRREAQAQAEAGDAQVVEQPLVEQAAPGASQVVESQVSAEPAAEVKAEATVAAEAPRAEVSPAAEEAPRVNEVPSVEAAPRAEETRQPVVEAAKPNKAWSDEQAPEADLWPREVAPMIWLFDQAERAHKRYAELRAVADGYITRVRSFVPFLRKGGGEARP